MHYTLFEGLRMLGDLIYEGNGKTIGIRMLDNKGTIEMTLQEEGKILGIHVL